MLIAAFDHSSKKNILLLPKPEVFRGMDPRAQQVVLVRQFSQRSRAACCPKDDALCAFVYLFNLTDSTCFFKMQNSYLES